MNVIHPRNELNILIDPMIKQELNEIKYRNNKDIFDNSFYYQVFLCSIDGNFNYYKNIATQFSKFILDIVHNIIISVFYFGWWSLKITTLLIYTSFHNIFACILYGIIGEIGLFHSKLYSMLMIVSVLCSGLQHHLITINVMDKNPCLKCAAISLNLIKLFQIVLQILYLYGYCHEYPKNYGLISLLIIIPILNIMYNLLIPYYLLNICKNYNILKLYNLNQKAYQILHNKALEYIIATKFQFKRYIDVERQDCSICMNAETSSNLIITNCNHIFHYKCLITWIGTSILNNNSMTCSCPYCRQDLTIQIENHNEYDNIPNLDI